MVAQPLYLGWNNPVRVSWGTGCFHHLQFVEPAVVLADRHALRNEDEVALVAKLGTRCVGWSWFTGGLASMAMAEALAAELWPAMQDPTTRVLAIGGGSTLDLAKVLRYRMQDDDALIAHWRNNTFASLTQRHRLTLVPTTAGTGSEVTRWATLWDTGLAEPVKCSWSPEDGYADNAAVDPLLTLSCPSRLTRDCALDALSHGLEALWNRNSTPVSEALALEAARGVINTLPALLAQPHSVVLREALSRASLLAGMAMSQTQTALAHALSYQLTLQEGLPHGEACAVWLPMVWELALGADSTCDAALARVFGCSPRDGVVALSEWLKQMEVTPRDLRYSPEGLQVLNQEMRSARGRNFIASL